MKLARVTLFLYIF